MRKLYYILLLSSILSYSQEQLVSERIKSYDPEEQRQVIDKIRRELISKEYSLEHEQAFGIDAVGDNKNEYTFRLSFDNTFITLYRHNEQVFGDIKLSAKSMEDINASEIFMMTYNIPQSQAQQILQLIDSTAVDIIPSQEYIEGWRQGFDGVYYTLQQKRDSTYTFKNYWSPQLFKQLPEAVAIEQFVDRLLKIVNYREIFDDFRARIPFYTYNTGSMFITTKILTTQEYRQKKREARKRKRKLKA